MTRPAPLRKAATSVTEAERRALLREYLKACLGTQVLSLKDLISPSALEKLLELIAADLAGSSTDLALEKGADVLQDCGRAVLRFARSLRGSKRQ